MVKIAAISSISIADISAPYFQSVTALQAWPRPPAPTKPMMAEARTLISSRSSVLQSATPTRVVMAARRFDAMGGRRDNFRHGQDTVFHDPIDTLTWQGARNKDRAVCNPVAQMPQAHNLEGHSAASFAMMKPPDCRRQ